MNGPILTTPVMSKLPLGLLGFFGIKNGGAYPQQLGNVLVPQMDMTDLLAVNYRENHVFQANTVAVGFLGQLDAVTVLPAVVPNGEVWYLSSYSAAVFTGAGDAISATMVVRSLQSGSANGTTRALSNLITQGAAITTQNLCPDAGSRWVYPGDTFGAFVSSITSATGNINCALHVQLTRYPF